MGNNITENSRMVLSILHIVAFCVIIAAVIMSAAIFMTSDSVATVPAANLPATEPNICDGNTIDVAIVGAGISGIYTAYKMSQNHDWNIQIYDTNDRVGGRVFSVSMPGISDFKADIGAMRFKKSHKRLLALAEELGLTIQPFNTPNENDTLYYLRGELLSKLDLASGNVPYNMTEEERALVSDSNALHAYWSNMLIANSSKNASYWDRVCSDGQLAYEKGIYNAFLEVGSFGAIQFAADQYGFPGWIKSNMNFADLSDTEYSSIPNEQMYTFKEGFQELTTRMMDKVLRSTRNQIHLKHHLETVSHNGTLGILYFMDKASQKMTNVCANNIVLGLPGEALKQIYFEDKDIATELEDLLPAVKQGPATKTFLVYDNPWWRNLGKGTAFEKLTRDRIDLKFVVTDLPVELIQEIGVDDETGSAMLLIYNGWWENIDFWSPYLFKEEQHNPEIESEYLASEKLIHQVNIQLAKVFNMSISDIPMPLSSVSHGWFEAPYWTGWHVKLPGYHWPTVMDKVIKPVSSKGVYIVGEAFSSFHGKCEGALETSQNMLTEYFDI